MDYLLSTIIDKLTQYSTVNNTPFDDENRNSIAYENPLAKSQLLLAKQNKCCKYFWII